jgi:hypothetical protein
MMVFQEGRVRMVVVVVDSVNVLFNEVIIDRMFLVTRARGERDDGTCHFNAQIGSILGPGRN